MWRAKFSGVGFSGAQFSGGTVGFNGAQFCGGVVDFGDARDWSFPPAFSKTGRTGSAAASAATRPTYI